MDSFAPFVVNPVVYVLELENGCYYCGISFNFNQRMSQHFGGFGSKWTAKNRPLRLHKVIWPGSKEIEDSTTIDLMKQYGPEKVRGGRWCSLNPPRITSDMFVDANHKHKQETD